MRKIIVISMCLFTCFGFSQEKQNKEQDTFIPISNLSLRVKPNKFQVRFSKTLFGIQNPFQLQTNVGFSRASTSIGMTFILGKKEKAFLYIGTSVVYEYEPQTYFPSLSGSFGRRFTWGRMNINYSSPWFENYSVNTLLMFNIHKQYVRLGMVTRDQYIGSRAEFEIPFKIKKKNVLVRPYATYIPDQNNIDVGVSARFDFRKFFPKWSKTFDDTVDWLNVFD